MNSAGRSSLSISLPPGEFVHLRFLLELKLILKYQVGIHMTWGLHRQKGEHKNPLPSQALLGEITVICRQNPQIATYNPCQVYTATVLSFFKPFSFLSTEQQSCSTVQVKSFKGMEQNFSFIWHNIVWPRHQLSSSFYLDIQGRISQSAQQWCIFAL